MSDYGYRKAERSAQAEGDINNIAKALREKRRQGANMVEQSKDLKGLVPDIRKEIFMALEITEDEQVVLEVMSLMHEQLNFAIANAIRPREGDAEIQESEAIIKSIEREMTPLRAREILQFHEPRLVLAPVTSLGRYREELTTASQTMEGSEETLFSSFVENQLNAQANKAQVEGNKIKKWKFAITEGAQTFDIPEWDNVRESLQQRIERYNVRFAEAKMTRLDFQSYIALMIQGLRQGRPIDFMNYSKQNAQYDWQYTLLNEMDEDHEFVGDGHWDDDLRRVFLTEKMLVSQHNDYARFRHAVIGDIKEKIQNT